LRAAWALLLLGPLSRRITPHLNDDTLRYRVRTSENSVTAKFAEFHFHALR
jgi:hypothetical protein